MIGRAYAPAHITGFFAVKQHQNPIKAGSIGCGLCLEAGVTATITVDPSYIGSVIRFNGKQIYTPAGTGGPGTSDEPESNDYRMRSRRQFYRIVALQDGSSASDID